MGSPPRRPGESDLERSWRQTIRWLVADVPARVEVSARPKADATAPAVDIRVRVRDAEYRPLDNAKVSLKITLPGGEEFALDAEPEGREAGTYAATYVRASPAPTGCWRPRRRRTAQPSASARPAGRPSPPPTSSPGSSPTASCSRSIAARTKGEVVDGDRLSAFVASLSSRDAPINEPWISPLWHQPLYFLIAIACLAAEWGLRRVNGLA